MVNIMIGEPAGNLLCLCLRTPKTVIEYSIWRSTSMITEKKKKTDYSIEYIHLTFFANTNAQNLHLKIIWIGLNVFGVAGHT